VCDKPLHAIHSFNLRNTLDTLAGKRYHPLTVAARRSILVDAKKDVARKYMESMNGNYFVCPVSDFIVEESLKLCYVCVCVFVCQPIKKQPSL
jgi:hypothetical protein